MKNRLQALALALALTAPLTLADFRYEQTTRMTGGAMMAMMKMAAKMSKGAIDPVSATVAVKGNRMVMSTGQTAMIYDLDKETLTEVRFEKKEYSVTTFAEMKAFFAKTIAKGGSQETSLEVDVKDTGKEEVIAGMKAREYLLTMKMEATNPQTGQKGEMQMEISIWMAPKPAGYQEYNDFSLRMSEKLDAASVFGNVGHTGMGKGMAAATKKMAAMDGIPVLQIMRMIPTDPEQLKQVEEAHQAQANQPPMPSGDQAAGQAAAGAIAGRLGRLGSLGVGGLGGLRKKKQEEVVPPPAPATPPVAEATGPKGSFKTTAALMEMTVEMRNHSNAAVDDGMFAIPDGFKAVKSVMQ